MKWIRVNESKDKKVKEPNKYMELYETKTNRLKDRIKDKIKDIKESILFSFDKLKRKKKGEPKASFYYIKTENSLSKSNIIMTVAIASAVLVLVVATIILVCMNIEQDKKQEENRLKMEEQYKQEEEEKARALAEKEAERQAKLPKLTEEGLQNMENIYFADKRRVFLTFDDGPSSNTEPILNILKQENIKATFFELGSRVEAQPESVKRAYDEGHYIASHGYSHVYSKIYQSVESVLDEYNQCIQAIRNAIGEAEYDPHLFRFPGGLPGGPYADLKKQAKEVLLQNGILNIDWNALSGDAEGNDLPVEVLMARLTETVGEKNNIVLFMHDSQQKTTTVEALPQIIAFFRDRGYEFVNFYEVIK